MNHPLASAPRLGAATACGGVESYLRPRASGALVFPARSVQVPDTDTVAESGPLYEAAGLQRFPNPGHVARRLRESDGERAVVPAVRVGARLAAAATPGAVESYWSENRPTRVLPATSVQMPVTEAVAESGPE